MKVLKKGLKYATKSPLKYGFILVLILIVLNGMVFRDFNSVWESLIEGLLTEVIGAIIIYVLIEMALARHNDEKEMPRKKAYYKEIEELHRKLKGLFTPPILRNNDTHKKALDEITIFSIERLRYIEDNMNFWGGSGITYKIPKMPMTKTEVIANQASVIKWYAKEIQGVQALGNKVLDRYNANLPPDIFGAVFSVIDDDFWKMLLTCLYALDNNKKHLNEGEKLGSSESRYLTGNSVVDWSNLISSAKELSDWLDANSGLSKKN